MSKDIELHESIISFLTTNSGVEIDDAVFQGQTTKEAETYNALRRVETHSGETVAVCTYDCCDTGSVFGNSIDLVALSRLRDGSAILEVHEEFWIADRKGIPQREGAIHGCEAGRCSRFLFVNDRIFQTAYLTPDIEWQPISPQTMTELLDPQRYIIGETMQQLRSSKPGMDPLNPVNTQARAAGNQLLQFHQLISPAAQEAFGIIRRPLA